MPPPRKANPALSADLAVVLETALEKDVGRRYATALELAEELRRVREYEPIVARPAGPLLRLRRWAQRNPVIATGTIGSTAALSIALATALVLLERVRTEEKRKEAALALYEGGWFRDEASSSLPDAPPRAFEFAIRSAERDPGLASNRVLLAALEALRERQVLTGNGPVVYESAIDPDSRRVATASLDGATRIWDVDSGKVLARYELGTGAVHAVRFSPDGTRIAYAGEAGKIVVRSLSDESALPIDLVGHTGDVHGLEFSADGTRLLTASRDRTARIFDVASGAQLVMFEAGSGSVAEARFVQGTNRVLTRSAEPLRGSAAPESDASKRLFDARTGAQIAVLRGSPGMGLAIDATADGRYAVAVCDDQTAQVWDLTTPEADPVHVIAAPGRYHYAHFSPDGKSLALSWDAGAKVVDVLTGADLYVLPSHGRRAIVRIAWSPDGRELATVAYDDALRVFRAEDGTLLRTCRGSARQIMGLAWSPDASFLVTWHRQKTVSIWYGADRPFLPVLAGHSAAVRTARFSFDGRRALTASDDGTARTWLVPSGAPELVLDPVRVGLERTPLLGAVFDASASRAAATDSKGRVLIWNARDGRLERVVETRDAAPIAAQFSPDGTRLALADGPGGVRILDLVSKTERTLRAHDGELTAMRFAPDGQRLATGGTDRRIALWDALANDQATSSPLWRTEPFETNLLALTHVFDLAFSPDGRFIAAPLQSAQIEVFDVEGHFVAKSVTMATPGLVAFVPEFGLLVGTSKYGRTTSMMRFPATATEAALDLVGAYGLPGEHHTNSMTALAKARNAPLAVTASLDRTVHYWDLEKRRCTASFSGHADAVFDADITADGAWILSASGDGTARLWPGDLLATARAARPAGFADVVGPIPRPAARE